MIKQINENPEGDIEDRSVFCCEVNPNNRKLWDNIKKESKKIQKA